MLPEVAREAAGNAPDRLPASSPDRLEVSLGQFSTAGAKSENQDFYGALEPENDDRITKGIALAIADGISTSRKGAQAAETAVKSFLTDYYCTSPAWSVRTAGERVITAANSWFHAHNARQRPREENADQERGALICTCSALVLKSRSAHLFHVGDGRIALIKRGRLESLTEPHRVDLGGGERYLGRALGANRAVEIDYRHVPLERGDLFMLSTDGVHEFVSDAQALALARRGLTLDDAAQTIADAARAAGSPDNLTVQLVRIDSLPSGEVGDLLGAELVLPPAPRLNVGDRFEGYAIVRELHSGSRSHVYLARDETAGELVALKVPSTEHAGDQGEMSALLLEDWVMRRVSHPNLLPAAARRGHREHIYLVTPYVEGQTLEQWMADHPSPGLPQVRKIISQLAAGLQALHRREMLHRDVRPRNVLIDAEDTVRIIDFGSVEVAGVEEIAPASARPGIFAGTVQYTAPELLLGQSATRHSDIFSLGVIAYQMLTRALPYGPAMARTSSRKAQSALRYRPAQEHDPDLPAWVDAALAKAVEVDPINRYDELSEFVFDLAHPNETLVQTSMPLLEQGTLRGWRVAALVLGAALAVSLFLHAT